MTESQTLRLMLARGDLDVAGGLSAPDVRALARRPDLAVERVRRGNLYYLAVNARRGPFTDERVRRAVLRHLIDFQGLVDTVLPFYGDLQQRPVPPGLPASLPQPGYRLDVAAARRLLAEAGLAGGFDTTIRVIAEAPFTAIATSVQATLAQAGIRAAILPGTGNQVYGAMRERSFDLVVGRGGGGSEPHPHSSLRALLYNPDNRDSARLSNFQGWRTGHADAVLNGLIEQALLERDPERQRALYQQAQERADAVVGGLQPIAQVLDTQVLRRVVQGYVGHPAGTTRLHGVFKDAAKGGGGMNAMKLLRGTGGIAVTLLGLLLLTFLIGRVMPLDPVLAVVGPDADRSTYEQVRRDLGLDQPLALQFAGYLRSLAHGDLGRALLTGNPVATDLARVLPATVELATLAIGIGTLLGVPLGVLAASHHRRWPDHLARVVGLLGHSTPVFWFGMMGLLVFYAWLGWAGGIGRIGLAFEGTVPVRTGLLLVDACWPVMPRPSRARCATCCCRPACWACIRWRISAA